MRIDQGLARSCAITPAPIARAGSHASATTPAWRVAGCERSACFFSASVRAMRASLVGVALGIAQVASLEPRRWCTRCHVHSTAATIPNVLGQTTHHRVDRHDRVVVGARARPLNPSFSSTTARANANEARCAGSADGLAPNTSKPRWGGRTGAGLCGFDLCVVASRT